MMHVYLVDNRATSRRYIGVSTAKRADYRHRLATDAKRRGAQEQDTLLADIFRDGMNNVTVTLLEECARTDVNARRNFWIGYFNTVAPAGYNFMPKS